MLRQFGLEYFTRYYATYRGFVVDNKDPEFKGRLILRIPEVYGKDNIPEYWAWPKGMFAGKQQGFFAIPNIDDPVWVSFNDDNPRSETRCSLNSTKQYDLTRNCTALKALFLIIN